MTPEELALFKQLLSECPEGPRIEFGVLRGATLKVMAKHSGFTIGVDSFEGMGHPGERDIVHGVNAYPKGRLSVSLSTVSRNVPSSVRLFKGFVPDILGYIPDLKFAFAHLDMDHYKPTLEALRWIWGRMLKGGIICCDDWFANSPWLAAGAIHDFSLEVDQRLKTFQRKAWWVR